MFPFVSSVEQVRAARAMIAEASADLAKRGIDAPPVPVGVMIEIPAAAYTADVLAPHHFSDRSVAFLPKPFTPVILVKKVREVLDGPCGLLTATPPANNRTLTVH